MPRRVFQANRWPFWEAKQSSSEYTNKLLPYSKRYMSLLTTNGFPVPSRLSEVVSL